MKRSHREGPMLFSLTLFPVGEPGSLAVPVAKAVEEIDRAGLYYQVTAMDTVIEGEWDEVMRAIGRAEQRMREEHDRVFMILTVDDHVGAENRLHGAVRDVMHQLGRFAPQQPEPEGITG